MKMKRIFPLLLCFLLFNISIGHISWANDGGSNVYSLNVNSVFSGTQIDGQEYLFNINLPSAGYISIKYTAMLDIAEGYEFRDELYGHKRSSSWRTVTGKVEFTNEGYFCNGIVPYKFQNVGNGTFELSVDFKSCSESFPEKSGGENNTIASATPISVGKVYRGLIALDDPIDVYAFQIDANGYYDISVEMLAYRAYTSLRLYDSNMNTIASKDEFFDRTYGQSGIKSLSENLQSGKYYLSIEDWYGSSDYELSVKKINDCLINGHKYGESVVIKRATCSSEGSSERTCSVCGEKIVDVIPATNIHKYSEWRTTKDATCASEGLKEKVCGECGRKETDVIPVSSTHNYGEWRTTEEATCVKEGLKEKVCKECGRTETDLIPATGTHKYGEWRTTKEATCTKEGSREKVCEECGRTETDVIPATGTHKYGEWKITKEATCASEGLKAKVCEECGQEKTEIIPKSDIHKYGEWKTAKEATCASEGIKEKVCEECGRKETDVIPVTKSHNFGEWIITKESTFKTEGEQEHVCLICGEKEISNIKKLKVKAGMVISDETTGCSYRVLSSKDRVFCQGPLKDTIAWVNIPNKIIYKEADFIVSAIGKNAFKNCTKLKKVNLGKNIKTISPYAFSGCKKLININIRTTLLEKVGAHALQGTNAKLVIKVPKKYLKTYKKILQSKGQSKEAKIQAN